MIIAVPKETLVREWTSSPMNESLRVTIRVANVALLLFPSISSARE